MSIDITALNETDIADLDRACITLSRHETLALLRKYRVTHDEFGNTQPLRTKMMRTVPVRAILARYRATFVSVA